MPEILRIDIDQELIFRLDSLGYLKSYKEVVEDLNNQGLKASVFFRPFIVPNKEFALMLMKTDKELI
jgi:hypothetical protein